MVFFSSISPESEGADRKQAIRDYRCAQDFFFELERKSRWDATEEVRTASEALFDPNASRGLLVYLEDRSVRGPKLPDEDRKFSQDECKHAGVIGTLFAEVSASSFDKKSALPQWAHAFELFVLGRLWNPGASLSVDPKAATPDGQLFLLFSELAFRSVRSGVCNSFWEPRLFGLVGATEIFVERAWDGVKRRMRSLDNCSQRVIERTTRISTWQSIHGLYVERTDPKALEARFDRLMQFANRDYRDFSA